MEGEITKTLIESQYPLWKIILLFILIQLIIILCSEWIKKLIEKQAISGITNKIKDIETKFINQTEVLKSQLSLLTNVKSEIYSTERNAIINSNEKLYQWLSHIMRLPTLDDNDDIDRYIKKMDDLYQEEQSSEALLELFIDDKSIIDNIHKISGYIYNLHIKKQIILFKLKKQNSNPELSESSLKELEDNTRDKLSKLIDKYEEISPLVHELRLDFKNYIYSKCLNMKPEA
ncbi:MAG TPA: hypothetical protein OIM59_08945 [Bacteroides mediterraneensis]|uniref:hypothetical protein n=1 Tax=Bacteroides mediterraneensis TaxID=1841856 RepID=UPI0026F23B2D|nr:hypothetical protein [Bacteroides mediterraneensis]HJH64738.1 hypothetical protein [Bacteroides mediterraneensis]